MGMLHALWHFYSKERHGNTDNLCHILCQYKALLFLRCGVGIEDTVVVIELIKLLRQFVTIVGYTAGRIVFSSLFHSSCKLVHLLYELYLFCVERRLLCIERCAVDTLSLGFAKDRADTGVGILNERTCVAVEVDAFLGIEEHILAGIDLQYEVLSLSR